MNIKALLPLIILFFLGGLTFYFTQNNNNKQDNPNEDWVMHVENEDDIHRVFIADRSGGKADLVREGDHWIYNGKHRANPNVMFNVLSAITNIRLKNRPAAAAVPNMIKVLSSQSTKVEVYGKNNKLLKAFYVGGATPDERGTFMIMEGSNNPYVMHIPMTEVSLKQRFFTGDNKWRDKSVFQLLPKDISMLSIEYPKRKNKSFTLKHNKGKWDVEPFFPTTRKIEKSVNQDLVNSYLGGFKQVGAEAFKKRDKQAEQAMSSKPFCIVNLLLTDGSSQQVTFYPILKFEDATKDKPLPIERYIAVNEKGDIYLTQHRVFEDIFWAYEFFF